jgi:hypothetical protein
MNKHKTYDQTEIPVSTASRRARLDALVFSRSPFGTGLGAPGQGMGPKLPPFMGE